MVAHCFRALLDGLHPADIHPDGGIELQSPAAGGGLRVTEHDAHLFTQLVDEHNDAVGLCDNARQLSQGLGHKPCLKAHNGVSHLSLDLLLGDQGCHGVDDDDVHGAAAHHGVCDLQGLFTVIRLGNVKVVDVHTDVPCIYRVKGMLRVDEACDAAPLLYLGHHVQCHRGLTGGLRTVDLDHPASGNAAQAQGDIQAQGAGGYGLNVHIAAGISQLHNGAFAEISLDLFDRGIQRPHLVILVDCHLTVFLFLIFLFIEHPFEYTIS